MQSGRVESLKLLSHIKPGLDYCAIQIDFDELRIFGSYNDLTKYIQKYVKYETAEDVYQGEVFTRVADLCLEHTIQTVNKNEGVKLIPEVGSARSICNFSVESVRPGDTEINCIALLCGYEQGSSSKAKWADLNMIDRNAKSFSLRIFTNDLKDGMDPDLALQSMCGKYLKFNISSTKYGLQTSAVEVVDYPVVCPPEVEIAVEIITQSVATDTALQEYVAKYKYLDTLKGVLYGEPGYHLVELASELCVIDTLDNIASEYDIRLLRRAAVTSRGYLLPSKHKFSKVLLNTNKVLRSELREDIQLLELLDVPESVQSNGNKRMFYRIKKLCRQVVEERRGFYEEDVTENFNYCSKLV